MFRMGFLALIVIAGVYYTGLFKGAADTNGVQAITIETLLRQRSRYDGKTLQLRGTVGQRLSVAGYGGFQLMTLAGDDHVLVITDITPPAPGEPIQITGRFRLLLSVGAFTLPAIFEEARALPVIDSL
jgi:hypothetical protein